jgi:hypothetical protein
MKKILVMIFAAMVLVWGVGTTKAEAYMIDFGIDFNSGSNVGQICFDSTIATLYTSTGIEVDNAVAGTGSLDFGKSTTFLNFSMTGAADQGGGNYTFTGGTIDIVSSDAMFGGSVTLLSGNWDSSQVVSLYTLPDGKTKIVFGSFNDSKNGWLLNLLNIPGYSTSDIMIPGFIGGLNLQFIVPVGADCSSQVYSGDVTNSRVPIPPSAAMLFFGLLGFVGVRRMRRDS